MKKNSELDVLEEEEKEKRAKVVGFLCLGPHFHSRALFPSLNY